MRLENEPLFVLHRRAFGETSVTLELFTKSAGRIGAMARGARQLRPKSGKVALQAGTLFAADLLGTGELLSLRRFDVVHSVAMLHGERALALIYLNELLLELLPRFDAHPALFERYQTLLLTLDTGDLAPKLRLFERALLEELGYGVDFSCDVTGAEIALDASYRIDVDAGFVIVATGAQRAIPGAAIAEFSTEQFTREHTRATRELMRTLIAERLAGKTLNSWQLLADLAGMRR